MCARWPGTPKGPRPVRFPTKARSAEGIEALCDLAAVRGSADVDTLIQEVLPSSLPALLAVHVEVLDALLHHNGGVLDDHLHDAFVFVFEDRLDLGALQLVQLGLELGHLPLQASDALCLHGRNSGKLVDLLVLLVDLLLHLGHLGLDEVDLAGLVQLFVQLVDPRVVFFDFGLGLLEAEAGDVLPDSLEGSDEAPDKGHGLIDASADELEPLVEGESDGAEDEGGHLQHDEGGRAPAGLDQEADAVEGPVDHVGDGLADGHKAAVDVDAADAVGDGLVAHVVVLPDDESSQNAAQDDAAAKSNSDVCVERLLSEKPDGFIEKHDALLRFGWMQALPC